MPESWLRSAPSSKIEFSILLIVLPMANAKEPPTATLLIDLSSMVSRRVGWFLTLLSPTPISPFEFEPQTTILLS